MNFIEMVNNNPFDWNKQEAAHLKSLNAPNLNRYGKVLCAVAALSTIAGAYAKYALGMKITFTASILATSAVVVIAAVGIYLIFKKNQLVQEILANEKDFHLRVVRSDKGSILTQFRSLLVAECSLTVLSAYTNTKDEIKDLLTNPDLLYPHLEKEGFVSQKVKDLVQTTLSEANKATEECFKPIRDCVALYDSTVPGLQQSVVRLQEEIATLTRKRNIQQYSSDPTECERLNQELAPKNKALFTQRHKLEEFKRKYYTDIDQLNANFRANQLKAYSLKLTEFRTKLATV